MRVARPRIVVLAALCTSVIASGVPAASAQQPPGGTTAAASSTTSALPCPVTLSTPLFAAWGDQSLYTPFNGSTFESGAQGWSSTGGAGIVSDDDQMLSKAGTHAMQIPGGATATSAPTCVDSTTPSMRLFIRRISGTGTLTISGTLFNNGRGDAVTLATISGTAAWAPTASIVFPSALNATVGSGSLSAQFIFKADRGTTFRIDDVELDPYRRT